MNEINIFVTESHSLAVVQYVPSCHSYLQNMIGILYAALLRHAVDDDEGVRIVRLNALVELQRTEARVPDQLRFHHFQLWRESIRDRGTNKP